MVSLLKRVGHGKSLTTLL